MFGRHSSPLHCKLYGANRTREKRERPRKAADDFCERCTVKFDTVNRDISGSPFSFHPTIPGLVRDIGYWEQALFHIGVSEWVLNLDLPR